MHCLHRLLLCERKPAGLGPSIRLIRSDHFDDQETSANAKTGFPRGQSVQSRLRCRMERGVAQQCAREIVGEARLSDKRNQKL